MIIKLVSYYEVDKNTLDSLINGYIEDIPKDFNTWIIDNIDDYCFDDEQKTVSGDIKSLYELCQKALELENEKYNALKK